jgi:hypothetical protein
MMKNIKRSVMNAMLKIQEQRALKGKQTNFRFNGRVVNGSKLVRSRKRFRRESLGKEEEENDIDCEILVMHGEEVGF